MVLSLSQSILVQVVAVEMAVVAVLVVARSS